MCASCDRTHVIKLLRRQCVLCTCVQTLKTGEGTRKRMTFALDEGMRCMSQK